MLKQNNNLTFVSQVIFPMILNVNNIFPIIVNGDILIFTIHYFGTFFLIHIYLYKYLRRSSTDSAKV